MAIDDKYEEDIQKLIDVGKEKGYLTYNEVNDLIPGDMTSPEARRGIAILVEFLKIVGARSQKIAPA